MSTDSTTSTSAQIARPAGGALQTGKPAPTTVPASVRPVFLLTGRINSAQQVGQDADGFPIIETVLLVPAADTYSYPNRYCVTSKSKLGRDGDDISIEVEVQCRPWRDQKGRWHYPHYLWAI